MLPENVLEKVAPKNTIMLGYRGSVSHGTYVEKYGPENFDDKDLLGVYVAPKEYYLGLSEGKRQGQKEVMESIDGVLWDSVVYEIRKMFGLLLGSNPNVLSMLWLPEDLNVLMTPQGRKIVDNRNIFVSKKAYMSFIGYANGQLKKLSASSGPTGKLGAKRKALIEKYSYDTKNASHLIRLLRMGIEFLTEGEMVVRRPDAAELVEIKTGKWSLRKVIQESSDLYALAEQAYKRSPLPEEPDFLAAEKILIEILEETLWP